MNLFPTLEDCRRLGGEPVAFTVLMWSSMGGSVPPMCGSNKIFYADKKTPFDMPPACVCETTAAEWYQWHKWYLESMKQLTIEYYKGRPTPMHIPKPDWGEK